MNIQNSTLAVIVIPEEGGRISSLVSRRSGLEFLTQARSHLEGVQAGLRASFENGPCAGIEECLPTVGACQAEGGPVPDHGDFWQLAWQLLDPPTGTRVRLQADGFSRPLRFQKELRLQGGSLEIRYRLENVGAEPTSFLYAAHPLLAVDAGDRIVLPPEVEALTLHYSRQQKLGRSGAQITWPRPDNTATDLSVTEADTAHSAEMLYTARLEQGRCGLYRAREQQGIIVSFNPEHQPFLGVWLCYGGWPDIENMPLQYAVALEPTLAPCGTLAEAQQRSLARRLLPGEVVAWQINFEITPSLLSYPAFMAQVHRRPPHP